VRGSEYWGGKKRWGGEVNSFSVGDWKYEENNHQE